MAAPLTSAWVIDCGRKLGFDKVGVAPVTGLDELAHFPRWLDRGFAGDLRYMHNPRRLDVCRLLPGARSVICCALGYDSSLPRSTQTPLDPERGWVSRYAWGEDYHSVIEEKLEALREQLAARAGDSFECKLYADTGPVLERVYAAHAGLGWQGKNTCLIDPELGSFFFLGLLVTNLVLDPDSPPPDQCGACTLCLDACPTGAITEPYVLDARRCISYLTIELRDSIPGDLRAPMGRHIFGCDICQDVCPWNEKSIVPELPQFQPRTFLRSEGPPTPAACAERSRSAPAAGTPSTGPSDRRIVAEKESLFHPLLAWLAAQTEVDFRRTFKGSPLKRAKWRGLLRNTLIAMGNSRRPEFRPILERFADDNDSLLAEHARWALDRLTRLDRIDARAPNC